MRRDAGSGENIDLTYITRQGFKRMDREDVKKLL